MSGRFLLPSPSGLAAEYHAKILTEGASAVDATMGRGRDTLRLCRLVGDGGHVDAFDIQPEALDATRGLLLSEGLLARATLHLLGHERMREAVAAPVRLAVFNLGWLPGGDRGVTTRAQTTLPALEAALSLLEQLGACVICVYPGHSEGERELLRLTERLRLLRADKFAVLRHQFLNGGRGAAECLVVQKLSGAKGETGPRP